MEQGIILDESDLQLMCVSDLVHLLTRWYLISYADLLLGKILGRISQLLLLRDCSVIYVMYLMNMILATVHNSPWKSPLSPSITDRGERRDHTVTIVKVS